MEKPLIPEEEMDRMSTTGRAIYDNHLKSILEPTYNGQIVAIHLDTGDYEVAANSSMARRTLRQRHPAGMIMTTDVGPAKLDSLMCRMIANQFLSAQQK